MTYPTNEAGCRRSCCRILGFGFLTALFFIPLLATPSGAAPWFDVAWQSREVITVDNTGGPALVDFQVEVTLDSTFPFILADPNGNDVRVTDDSGTTLIDYWIESWDSGGTSAVLWVEVPSIPADGVTTLYLYFDNPLAPAASDGESTFLFFDDFEADPDGYFGMSPPQTILVQDQAWEASAPHTMSVVKVLDNPPLYYGYYGLQAGGTGVGLATSTDLQNWTKWNNNPMFFNGRWPSVVRDGFTFYMVVTKDYGGPGPSHLVLRSSPDGLNFTEIETVVPAEAGARNQNPHLFYNEVDDRFYLYWFRKDVPIREIWVRSASAVEDLDVAPSVLLLSSTETIAAPNMMYYDGTYILAVETFPGGVWHTEFYESTSPVSGFVEVPGNPIIGDGTACFFQHIFGNTMHAYYCKETASVWTLDYRTADLSAGRVPNPVALPPAKWSPLGGLWQRQPDIGPDGNMGRVVEGITSDKQTLKSTYSGQDYVLEAHGRLLAGRVWGLNVRVNSNLDLYTSNLYEDLDGFDNLYLYRFAQTGNGTVASSPLGPIDFASWYEMRVDAHGDSFEVYIDDVLWHSGSDSTFFAGSPGLYGEAGTTAQFEDVRVRKYSDPQPTATLSPVPVPLGFDPRDGVLGWLWVLALAVSTGAVALAALQRRS